VNQNSAGVSAIWDLFINPAGADIVKLLPGDDNVAFAIDCASVMTPLNANGQAHGFLNIVEGANDGMVNLSINGGTLWIEGNRSIGTNVHQINTAGNTVDLSTTMIDDDFATDPSTLPNNISPATLATLDFTLPGSYGAGLGTAAANQPFPIWPYDWLPVPGSVNAIAGLAPGTPFGNGLAAGFSLGGGSSGGSGGGSGGSGNHHGGSSKGLAGPSKGHGGSKGHGNSKSGHGSRGHH